MSGRVCEWPHDDDRVPAVWLVTYSNGSYRFLETATCDAHLDATRASVFPGLDIVTAVCRSCGHPVDVHGPYGCEHIGRGHGNSRAAVSLHGCTCSLEARDLSPVADTMVRAHLQARVTDADGWPLGFIGPPRPPCERCGWSVHNAPPRADGTAAHPAGWCF